MTAVDMTQDTEVTGTKQNGMNADKNNNKYFKYCLKKFKILGENC